LNTLAHHETVFAPIVVLTFEQRRIDVPPSRTLFTRQLNCQFGYFDFLIMFRRPDL
jgi:hypothetical protein